MIRKQKESNKLLELYSQYRREEDMDALGEFIQELMKYETFYVAINIDKQKQKNGEKKIVNHILSITNNANEIYIPIFTSEEDMKLWNKYKRKKYVVKTFDEICYFINKNMEGFVLNPFSDNIMLPKKTIMGLKIEKEEKSRNVKVTNHIGQIQNIRPIGVDEIPDNISQNITRYFYQNRNINNIWFCMVVTEDRADIEQPLIIIDSTLDEFELEETYKDIMAILGNLFGNNKVNFIIYDEEYQLKGNNMEFYKKY